MKTTEVKRNLKNFKLSLHGPYKTGAKWIVKGKDVESVEFTSATSAARHFDLSAKELLIYELQLDQVVALAIKSTTRRQAKIKEWLLSAKGISSSDLAPIQRMKFSIPRQWRSRVTGICNELNTAVGKNLLRTMMKRKAGSICFKTGAGAPGSVRHLEHHRVRQKK